MLDELKQWRDNMANSTYEVIQNGHRLLTWAVGQIETLYKIDLFVQGLEQDARNIGVGFMAGKIIEELRKYLEGMG